MGYGAPVPEELSRAVATQVNRLLDERGMSGNALSKATGMPQTSIAAKLSGRSRFDLDDLAAICAALGVTVSDLISWAERA